MPVEIREIIIRTVISATDRNHSSGGREEDFQRLRRLVLDECKKIIAEKTKKSNNKR